MSVHSTATGTRLADFVDAVRSEYWARAPYDEFAGSLRQGNTVRVVACQVLEELSDGDRSAIAADLSRLDSLPLVRSDPREVFETSDSIASFVFDLACEVAWQSLVTDLSIRVEDEIRAALTDG
jgi:hypothetical protein